jgi:hypothetical protein
MEAYISASALPIDDMREQVRLAVAAFGNVSLKKGRTFTSREVLDAMTPIFKLLKELEENGNPAPELKNIALAFQGRYILDPIVALDTAREHLDELHQDLINWFAADHELAEAMGCAKVFAWRIMLFLTIVTGLELTTLDSDESLVKLDAVVEQLFKLVATTEI